MTEEKWIDRRRMGQAGATMVEYALMVALVAIVCVTAIVLLSGDVKTAFVTTVTSMNGSTTGP